MFKASQLGSLIEFRTNTTGFRMKKRNRSGQHVGGSSAAIKYNKTVNKVLLSCQISQRFVQNKISRVVTIDRKIDSVKSGAIWRYREI